MLYQHYCYYSYLAEALSFACHCRLRQSVFVFCCITRAAQQTTALSADARSTTSTDLIVACHYVRNTRRKLFESRFIYMTFSSMSAQCRFNNYILPSEIEHHKQHFSTSLPTHKTLINIANQHTAAVGQLKTLCI
jgi:hypothetical protein